MKLTYNEGDIFVIPMRNGKFAICQIVFSPNEKFQEIIGFCVLFIQNDKEFRNDGKLIPLALIDMGNEIKVMFSGKQDLNKGLWEIIDHVDLNEDKEKLKTFNFAGGLYHGEEEISRIPVSEYQNYTSMEVFGFEVIDNVLTANA